MYKCQEKNSQKIKKNRNNTDINKLDCLRQTKASTKIKRKNLINLNLFDIQLYSLNINNSIILILFIPYILNLLYKLIQAN